ncbi:hypothetical protein [Roseibium sp.]|uniref:Bbp19 family protein n=1 Tax=Roseibium sp. TaxID=1936156 RepID=UPI003D131579
MSEDFDLLAVLPSIIPALRSARTKDDRYADFRHVFFGSEAGRRVLNDILDFGYVARPASVHQDGDAGIRNEGKRQLALTILAAATVDPKQIQRMPTKRAPANQRWKGED